MVVVGGSFPGPVPGVPIEPPGADGAGAALDVDEFGTGFRVKPVDVLAALVSGPGADGPVVAALVGVAASGAGAAVRRGSWRGRPIFDGGVNVGRIERTDREIAAVDAGMDFQAGGHRLSPG